VNTLLRRARDEDHGTLTFEWILLITVLVIGVVGGLSAVRDGIIDELGDVVGDVVGAVVGAVVAAYVVRSPGRSLPEMRCGGWGRGRWAGSKRSFRPVFTAGGRLSAGFLRAGSIARLSPP
jgi:hypothetical protein